jgi:hypothetical protein
MPAVLFWVAGILWSANLPAQGLSDISYEIKYHRGVIMPHYKSFKQFMGERIPAVELNAKWKLSGNKAWHAAKKYPSVGFGLFYSDLKNKNILGSAFGIHALSEYQIVRYKPFSLSFRLSPGLVYITKKYDMLSNPYNVGIGSHLNALIQAGLILNARLNEQFTLSGGLSLIHFSNASFALPNAGLNQLSLSVALNYNYHSAPVHNKEFASFTKEHNFLMVVSGGFHQYRFEDEQLYFAGSLQAEYEFRLSRGSSLALGVDYFYDSALRKYINSLYFEDSKKLNDQYAGLHLGYYFYMGNLSAFFHIGPYIKYRPAENQNIYSRIGLRYTFARRYIASLGLKTYYAKADFLEFGLGYYFFRSR